MQNGRSREHAAIWGWDDWDASALHLVEFDETDTVIAALRVHCDPPWPLEHKLGRSIASSTGMEIGRLNVAARWHNGRRTLFELLLEVCRRAPEWGKTHAYGLVVDSFWRALATQAIPMHEVDLNVATPYGSPTHLIRFEFTELVEYHTKWSQQLPRAGLVVKEPGPHA